jgi:glycosyltransferase involved in cell wall biosynthesis
MKILQLCKKYPFPLKDGESIAVNVLSKAMKSLGCEVTLLTMNTTKHFYAARATPRELCHYDDIHSVPVDNRIKWWDAFVNLFSSESYHISRFVSPAFKRRLAQLLREKDFDLVQLETLYLAPYIPVIREYSEAPIAMRAHNVEHEIWERVAGNTRFPPRKWYLRYLAGKLERFECAQLANYDILAPISERDHEKFRALGYQGLAAVTPIGLDPADYQPDYRSYRRELSIAFIGSLDWMPNQEGLKWFLEQVWPRLQRQFPRLKLYIAGRNTPEWLFRQQLRNVVVHGEVADASNFINAHSLMVVPLLSGSGMRAKILEGMALGKTVISTRLGLEGIPARHLSEVIVADSVEEFAQMIDFCYRHQDQMEAIGRRARLFIERHYEGLRAARQLLDCYASLLVEAI